MLFNKLIFLNQTPSPAPPTPTPVLPDAYQEVEYLRSNGSQYIDIGNNFDATNAKFEVKAKWNSNGGIGYFTNEENSFLILKDSSYFRAWIGSSNIIGSQDANAHTIVCDAINKKTTFDGTEFSYASSQLSITRNFILFAYYAYDRFVIDKCSMDIYSFKLYENSSLLNNLVPCYRKSDSEAGLYDLINDVFYDNDGTGTFQVGPDVN